ncbi:hypothetical protein [Morganella morganii]|uniref:hypothetical protein n=1 Tax=Morganella morganii TaxID=582 RepID=UPI001FFC5BEA|nr:hypothetical protein [Morganella morganii]
MLTVFFYVPLHSCPAGMVFGRFLGDDFFSTRESERLVRLPMFYNKTEEEQQCLIHLIKGFFAQ